MTKKTIEMTVIPSGFATYNVVALFRENEEVVKRQVLERKLSYDTAHCLAQKYYLQWRAGLKDAYQSTVQYCA